MTSRMRLARVLALLALVACRRETPTVAGQASAPPPARAVAGVVTLEGKPVAGATVTLTFLPALDAVTDGGYVAKPAASATTGADGTFRVPMPPVDANVLHIASLNGGTVNYTVDAFYPPGSTTYHAATGTYSHVVDGAGGKVLSVPEPVTLELT